MSGNALPVAGNELPGVPPFDEPLDPELPLDPWTVEVPGVEDGGGVLPPGCSGVG